MLAPQIKHAEPAEQKVIEVAVVRQTTLVSEVEVDNAIAVVQKQIDRDFTPQWGIKAHLSRAKELKNVIQDNLYEVLLQDYPPGPSFGISGYHDEVSFPFAYVYVGVDLKSWISIFSHEILEMLVDPGSKMVKFTARDGKDYYVALEICDPVEIYTYEIDGVQVSDFVFPSFYRQNGLAPYDMLNNIKAPFTLSKDKGFPNSGRLPVYELVQP